jgi:imidazolonepropionase-like amidohydrolase
VYAVKNAELALRCGYTGVASAGALYRIDVTIRDMIDEGIIPGPRMAASGRDICATSGMLDWNPSFWKLGMEGLSIFADGVDEVRRAVRQNIKEGCDVIKLYVTGEGLLRPGVPPEETMYSFEEIAVACDEAHKRNRQIAAHVRGNDGVKLCVEAGVDVLEHATYADDEAVDMIAARKDNLFVVPGLGYHWGILTKGEACGIPPDVMAATEYQEEWDLGCVAMRKLKEAGVRVVPGGDYGFVWCPHGEYAKDIELFVTDMGFTPMEAIVAATKHGAELLRLDHLCGTVEEGKCADLLVVDGDPVADIAILQDRSKLDLVMKDGKVMVNQLGLPQELHPIPDYVMDIEHIQNAKAAPSTMPTAAEVQH